MASYLSKSMNGSMSQNSGSSGGNSEELHTAVMDQRKRKRMISNRDSARRSRMKKQKRLNDLNVELAHLGVENGRLAAAVGATAQRYLALEAENSILRAQVAELTFRLESLNEIINCISSPSFFLPEDDALIGSDGSFTMNNYEYDIINNNRWNESIFQATQPLVAPADILMY
ncbi:hypothetical protein SAY87_028740 [Trapa incisa]|uniref:BZIP domain-containing protein n=1 Tax=Trapa incisa TaxID=236973 RepID=A0AAN7L2P7_9MYRT|nr:hypothetical protein SAY87_028740 [Trapa incisa]